MPKRGGVGRDKGFIQFAGQTKSRGPSGGGISETAEQTEDGGQEEEEEEEEEDASSMMAVPLEDMPLSLGVAMCWGAVGAASGVGDCKWERFEHVVVSRLRPWQPPSFFESRNTFVYQ